MGVLCSCGVRVVALYTCDSCAVESSAGGDVFRCTDPDVIFCHYLGCGYSKVRACCIDVFHF